MKCIVIQTSPERINAEPVTNEDGTPYIYATMAEARAEIKANGYIYNRANQRYYINGTEYRAYIIREDSEEYAEIIAEQAHEDAARRLVSAYAEAIGDSVTADDPEAIAAHRVARACIGLTTATDDDRATVAQMVEAIADRARESAALARYQTADAAARSAESFAEAAEWAADKIENDPAGDLAGMAHAAQTFAAHAAEAANAARLICAYDRAVTFADYETSAYAANALEYIDKRTADAAAAADRALAAAQRATDVETAAASADDAAARFCAALTEATGVIPYFEDAASVCKVARDDIAGEHRSTALDRDAVNIMTEAIADAARAEAAAAPIYQRYELLAYLGDPDAYDVDAIEAEATRFTADGARVWSAFGSDLAAIAERHEIVTYYAI